MDTTTVAGENIPFVFSNFHNCFMEPTEKCLSTLHLRKEIADDIWDPKSKDEKFNCLYDSWISTAYRLFENGVTSEKHMRKVVSHSCPPMYDDENCWPFTSSGHSEATRCPNLTDVTFPDVNVNRTCVNGVWSKSNYINCFTDYGLDLMKKACEAGKSEMFGRSCETVQDSISTSISTSTTISPAEKLREEISLIQRDIYFFGSCASLMLLAVALVIFCAFKTLQCPRVHIHKNLIISMMIQCIVHIVIFEPYVKLETLSPLDTDDGERQTTYIDYSWLCKTIFTLSNYVSMTNLFWGFVEGLFLISRISIAVFSHSMPYWLFHLVGWGLPAIFTVAWALCMQHFYAELDCWRASTPYFLLIMVPTVTIAAVNLIFLFCIIKILMTKLHAVNTEEHVQIRKAMKATVVLLPLLSLTSILFLWAPQLEASPVAHAAYRITTASLHVAQGILVSVIFCFFNGEVRSALLKHWKQFRSETFRYRSSRASSVCVTQSENLVILSGNQARRMSHSSHTAVDTTGTPV